MSSLPYLTHNRVIKLVTEICHDPRHAHHSPLQQCALFEINGQLVEITKDGPLYNARIEGVRSEFDLTEQELERFIKRYCHANDHH